MRVYEKAIEMNEKVARVAGPIGRCDRALLDQMRRAAMGVPLNKAPGSELKAPGSELALVAAASARAPRTSRSAVPPWAACV